MTAGTASNDNKPAFTCPYVAPSTNGGWGPPSKPDFDDPNAPTSKFALLPYAPFGRSDRLGRVADFTGRPSYHQQQQEMRRNRYRSTGEDNKEFQYKQETDESFQLVDTSKTVAPKRFVTPAARRRQNAMRLRQVNARRNQQNQQRPQLQMQSGRGRGGGGRGGGGRGGGGRGGRGFGGRGYNNRYGQRNYRVDRQASVSVQSNWVQVEELDLAKITKNLTASTEAPTFVDDILWCGFLDAYNDIYDKVNSRSPVPLKRNEHKEFYPVTTTDDPVLEKLAIDGTHGNVFCTETILAHLMTCTRSVYPWDLVLTKLPGGTLFFDKRDNSPLDFLTVNETAHASQIQADTSGDPAQAESLLGLEATMIHQNFSQQILRKSGRKEYDLPNPFFDEEDAEPGMEPASVAYRYRKFDLGNDTVVVCRTELHAMVKKSSYMTAFALNEHPINNQAIAWRDKIDSQIGAVLANELKNNSFKLAKWTAQSLLAGADQMKVGFVSRKEPKNTYEHVILATQFYRPKDFATQITLNEGQMWAMIRMFIALVRKQTEGKYVLMRDPNKAILRLYKVPLNTFEEDDDEEEGEE